MVTTRAQCRRRVILECWNGIESAEGVFTEILSRLPVRSIRSFKTINKYWCASLTHGKFAKKQLSQSQNKPEYIACPTMANTMELYLLKPGEFKYQHHGTVNPGERDEEYFMYMIASFNGLVCCINMISDENENENDLHRDLQIWICNPSIEETLLLPQGRPSFRTEPSIGVAYGSETGEYKVFRIFCTGQRKLRDDEIDYYESPYVSLQECEVYSSSSGAWRNIGPVPHFPMRACFSPYKSNHVFAGGKIYWLVSLDDPCKILSVDMMEERFEVMDLPSYSEALPEEDRVTEATHLINLGGSLSLVIIHGYYMDVWVREQSKWECVCTCALPFENHVCVLFVTSLEKEKEILLVTDETFFETDLWLWTFDLAKEKWNRRCRPPTEYLHPVILPFTQSLLPCNGGVNIA